MLATGPRGPGGANPFDPFGSAAANNTEPLTRNHLGQISPDQLAPTLSAAANQWGIPNSILSGVLGVESNYDQNTATSSAGAVGPFQFLPATAHQYNYPLVTPTTVGQFQQQADAAAHYLSDLYKQHGGNWDAALRAYSGGGYGLAKVQAQTHQTVPADETAAAGISIPNPLAGIAAAITGSFNQAVTDLKYGVVLLAALAVAVVLLTHGIRGSGGEGRKVVPIPV